MVQTREEKAAYDKAYRVKHKEKRAAQQKEYREANGETISAKAKAWYEANREENIAKKKELYEKNKEEILATHKEYNQTPSGKKSKCISTWKRLGLICDDIDALYDKVLNTKNCENCGVELTIDRHPTKTTRCMDHCHKTGLFRNVLCNPCNVKRR
tara:strand:+ start:94 stop:561 length:468 start_codon:yes stop_codon:yes gene_type:complete